MHPLERLAVGGGYKSCPGAVRFMMLLLAPRLTPAPVLSLCVHRAQAQYHQRRYGAPGPRTAAIKLPLGPNGAAGSAAFAAFAASNGRPVSAPP